MVYELRVQNVGDVPLQAVQVVDDLGETFAGASFTLVKRPMSADFASTRPTPASALLTPICSWAPTLWRRWTPGLHHDYLKVTPGANQGLYMNQALASGVSPAGTPVNDVSQDGKDTDPDTPDLLDPADNPQPGDDDDPTPVEFPVASISNLVWWDMDGDGIQDASEPGLSGITLFLDLDGNGQKDVNEPTVTTGACPAPATCGIYSFPGLLSGTYRVQIDPAEFAVGGDLYNWKASPKDAGTPNDDAVDSDGSTAAPYRAVVVLTPGQVNTTIDFGYLVDASYTVTKQLLGTPASVGSGEQVKFIIHIQNTGKVPITVLPLQRHVR